MSVKHKTKAGQSVFGSTKGETLTNLSYGIVLNIFEKNGEEKLKTVYLVENCFNQSLHIVIIMTMFPPASQY